MWHICTKIRQTCPKAPQPLKANNIYFWWKKHNVKFQSGKETQQCLRSKWRYAGRFSNGIRFKQLCFLTHYRPAKGELNDWYLMNYTNGILSYELWRMGHVLLEQGKLSIRIQSQKILPAANFVWISNLIELRNMKKKSIWLADLAYCALCVHKNKEDIAWT